MAKILIQEQVLVDDMENQGVQNIQTVIVQSKTELMQLAARRGAGFASFSKHASEVTQEIDDGLYNAHSATWDAYTDPLLETVSHALVGLLEAPFSYLANIKKFVKDLVADVEKMEAELSKGLDEQLEGFEEQLGKHTAQNLENDMKKGAEQAARQVKPWWLSALLWLLKIVIFIVILIAAIFFTIITLGVSSPFWAAVLIGAFTLAFSLSIFYLIDCMADLDDFSWKKLTLTFIFGAIDGASIAGSFFLPTIAAGTALQILGSLAMITGVALGTSGTKLFILVVVDAISGEDKESMKSSILGQISEDGVDFAISAGFNILSHLPFLKVAKPAIQALEAITGAGFHFWSPSQAPVKPDALEPTNVDTHGLLTRTKIPDLTLDEKEKQELEKSLILTR